ncbi:MAG: membrane protein [Chitinophagales bacterium]|nr:MAG: membrane protein [Chitinophagales bacterium]
MQNKALLTILLLVLSNTFMTFAWYGHLKFREIKWLEGLGLLGVIVISWAIAFFEYCFQVPANRIGYQGNGGPFALVELKVIQEAITLAVFIVFSLVFFKTETFRLNHLLGFAFLILAVYFTFKK